MMQEVNNKEFMRKLKQKEKAAELAALGGDTLNRSTVSKLSQTSKEKEPSEPFVYNYKPK